MLLWLMILLSTLLRSTSREEHLDSLCPVSRRIHTPSSHLFSYPVDIYNPTWANENQMLSAFPPYNCTSRRVKSYTLHHCTPPGTIVCPVRRSHLHAARSATSWSVRNYQRLGVLFSQIFDRNPRSSQSINVPLRLIFLGGSVTSGHETEGFCCTNIDRENQFAPSTFDRRCDFDYDCGFYFEKWLSSKTTSTAGHSTVSWIQYLSATLKSMSERPLEIYFFPLPGTTSNFMSSHVSGFLSKMPKRSEKLNDIVFIDYSYNDGRVFQGPKKSMLDQAIESLVRNILLSYPLSNDERPFIILLESYIHSQGVFATKCDSLPTCTENNNNVSVSTIMDSDYSTAYRRIAKHYGLLLWSARNIFWKLKDENDSHKFEFLSYMIQGHPPWHTHLYWADIYMSLMKLVPRHNIVTTDSGRFENESSIPQALIKAEDMSSVQCDVRSVPFADLSFDGNANHSSFYFTVPTGSWRFLNERGDKPGWITAHEFDYHTLVIPLSIERLVEWFSGKSKQDRVDRLTHRDIVIVLSYLKSYDRMLTASIQLCNHTVATENALWADKFSLSYTSILPIGHFMEKHCKSEIQLLKEKDVSSKTIEQLSVRVQSPAPFANSGDIEGKFKLLGLTVCETDTGGSPFFASQSLIQ